MTQKQTYLTVFFISVAFSIGGIPFAAFVTKDAADGGRGGAIGSTLALLFIFISRDYGTKLYEALTRELPDLKARIEKKKAGAPAGGEERMGTIEERVARLELKATEAKTELSTLVTRINIDAQGNRSQSIWLAVATCIGTMTWGFGDLAAKYLMPHSQ